MNSLLSAFPSVWLCIPLFTAVSCLVIHYLVYSRRVAQWRKSNIPFLWPSFLIGHKYFLNLTKYSSLVSIDRIYRENSDKHVVGFFLGTIPMVLIRNPAIIKQVFSKNFENTFETAMIGSRGDEVAQNTISHCADKDLWKSSRRTLTPMYTTSRMSGEAFAKIRMQIERMWAHAEQTQRMGSPLDAKKVSTNFMMDCISNNFFSLDTNSYEKPGMLHRMATDFLEPNITKMINAYAQIQFPGASIFDSLRIRSKKHIDSMADLIHQQILLRAKQQSGKNDLVDLLMRLKNGKEGSEMDITNQMIGFGFATAFGGQVILNLGCQWCFAIHLLSLHPEHQQRIRMEVAEAMKKHETSEFTYEVVRSLSFTEQCIYETARLFPNMFTMRLCSEDIHIPGMDCTFKKGDRVIFNPYSIHRDPAYFENPDKFNPDRFSPENKNTFSPDSYLAFGTGPRKCPGEKLALFMVSTLIASLLHRFEVKPRSHVKQMDATDLDPKLFGTFQRENLLVDIIPREVMTQ